MHAHTHTPARVHSRHRPAVLGGADSRGCPQRWPALEAGGGSQQRPPHPPCAHLDTHPHWSPPGQGPAPQNAHKVTSPGFGTQTSIWAGFPGWGLWGREGKAGPSFQGAPRQKLPHSDTGHRAPRPSAAGTRSPTGKGRGQRWLPWVRLHATTLPCWSQSTGHQAFPETQA